MKQIDDRNARTLARPSQSRSRSSTTSPWRRTMHTDVGRGRDGTPPFSSTRRRAAGVCPAPSLVFVTRT